MSRRLVVVGAIALAVMTLWVVSAEAQTCTVNVSTGGPDANGVLTYQFNAQANTSCGGGADVVAGVKMWLDVQDDAHTVSTGNSNCYYRSPCSGTVTFDTVLLAASDTAQTDYVVHPRLWSRPSTRQSGSGVHHGYPNSAEPLAFVRPWSGAAADVCVRAEPQRADLGIPRRGLPAGQFGHAVL